MKVKIHTDDGYQQLDFDHIIGEINIVQVVKLLYKNKVLSVDDMNSILPLGFEMVDEEVENGST